MVCRHQDIQIGKCCLQVVATHLNVVMVLFSHSYVFLHATILVEKAVHSKGGYNKCRIGVILYAEVNFTAFFSEIFHTEEGDIATKESRWIF